MLKQMFCTDVVVIGGRKLIEIRLSMKTLTFCDISILQRLPAIVVTFDIYFIKLKVLYMYIAYSHNMLSYSCT